MEKRGIIIIIVFLTLMFIMPSVVAQEITLSSLGTFEWKTDIDLKQICGNTTQTCTSCNITSVVAPRNATNIVQDVEMTQRPNLIEFNYTLDKSFTVPIGTYIVNGFCNAGEEVTVWAYTFEVTPSGFLPDTSKAIFYLILSVGVFLLFALSLFFTITIPFGNVKNDYGEIVRISKTKYLKLLSVLITYPLFLWFLNIMIGISQNFVNLSMFLGFFEFIFFLLVRLSFPVFVFIFVVTIFLVVRDSNVKNMITKFGKS